MSATPKQTTQLLARNGLDFVARVVMARTLLYHRPNELGRIKRSFNSHYLQLARATLVALDEAPRTGYFRWL